MKLKTMLASMLAIVALTSCEDLFEEGEMQPDGSKPSLTINNPTTNQSVSKTQGLRVYITAVDKDQVKNLEFVVRGSETTVITFNKAPLKNVIEFDTLISTQAMSSGTYQLYVRATDGRTNVAEKLVDFTVK